MVKSILTSVVVTIAVLLLVNKIAFLKKIIG
jgi:hypothetical protein